MRISEINAPQDSLAVEFNRWKSVNSVTGKQADEIWTIAQRNAGGGRMNPATALSSAITTYNHNVDMNQDAAARQRQADRTSKPFIGIGAKTNTTQPQKQQQQPTDARTRGGQLGNTNAYKGGPRPSGKSLKQVMKDKWKEFNDQDGLAGKDAAKGMYIARTLGNVGKGIADMGDKFRKAPK